LATTSEMKNMTQPDADPEGLLTPQEVTQAFRVDPKTVLRWAKEGKLRWVRTLGGHRRYFKSDVQRLLRETR
jgi:excisionase family DNA binding protein